VTGPALPSGRDGRNVFVGTGWNWPVEPDATGAIALISGTDELEQAMYLVLATAPGERPMRPEFGCRLQEYVFASSDANTAGLLADEVRRALIRWEPRIVVQDVVVSADADEPSTLWIDVRYTVRSNNDRRNLVFPFYTIPQHE
jgi:phage baseplate assembly protein W